MKPQKLYYDFPPRRDVDASDAALQQARLRLLTLPQGVVTRGQRARLLIDLASIYWRRSQYPEALNVWQQLIKLAEEEGDRTKLAMTYAAMASVYAQSGDYTTAIETAKRSLTYDSKNIQALFAMGLAYDYAGNDEEALRWWRRTLQQDPALQIVYENIGSLHYRRGAFALAEQFLLKALELEPDSDVGLNELGNMYITLERFDDAKLQFQTAMKLDPDSPNAYNNLANCYMKMGKLDEARRLFERRVEMRPKDALAANLSLGVIYRTFSGQKAREKSDAHFQRALVIHATKEARLLARFIEHDARRALAMSGLGDSEALALWRTVLNHPEIKSAGPGPLKDWLFCVTLLAQSPYPPMMIKEIVELLASKQW